MEAEERWLAQEADIDHERQRDLLQRNTPPMRDSSGRPMKNYDDIDFKKLIDEINKQENK